MQVAVSVRVKDFFKEDLAAPKPQPKRAWLRPTSVFFKGPSKDLPSWPSPSPLMVRPDVGLLERPLRRPNRTKTRSGATVRQSSLRGLRKALQLHPNHNQQYGFSSGLRLSLSPTVGLVRVSVQPSLLLLPVRPTEGHPHLHWFRFRCDRAFFL